MANFRPILVALLVLGLFGVAIITAGIRLASVNGANQSIGDDLSLAAYSSSLNQSLKDAYDSSVAANAAVSNSSITLTSTLPFIDAIGGIWKTLKSAPIAIWNLTFGIVFQNILGDNSYAIVIGVIGAILLMTIVFAVWKLISSGESG